MWFHQCGLRREFQMIRDETNHALRPQRMRQLRHLSPPLKGNHPLSPRVVCNYGLLKKDQKCFFNFDFSKSEQEQNSEVTVVTSRLL